MERVLYNGFGAAVATDGLRFFYTNPLQRREDHFEKDDPGRRRLTQRTPYRYSSASWSRRS